LDPRGTPSHEPEGHLSRGVEACRLLQARNQDPDGVLDDFDPVEADAVLYMACADFRNVCGGLPVEGDTFDLWFLAIRDLLGPLGLSELEDLRGITMVPRAEQINIGKRFLATARADAPANKHYSTR
jgi:hypothetical protein